MKNGAEQSQPVVPVGGGVPFDPVTGERFGYLPPKAAGRKAIIRRELGLRWVLSAAAFGVAIAAVATIYLAGRPDVPGAPFRDAGPLTAYPAGAVTALTDGTGWVDRRSVLSVFAARTADGHDVTFCRSDGGWVDGAQRRYDGAGRGSDAPGLRRLAVRAAGGRLYVDPAPTGPVPGAAASLPPCADIVGVPVR